MNNVAILQYGNLPSTNLVDEVGMSMKSMSVKPMRTKKLYKGAKNQTFAARYTDPVITFSFTGVRAAPSSGNLGFFHPGTQVTGLLNFAESYRGFDPTLGVMIYEEPEDTFNGEDPAETKFDVTQYPFIAQGTYVQI